MEPTGLTEVPVTVDASDKHPTHGCQASSFPTGPGKGQFPLEHQNQMTNPNPTKLPCVGLC